jgi:hypothetical protein
MVYGRFQNWWFYAVFQFNGLWKIPNLVVYEMSKFGGLRKERGEHPFNFFFLSIQNDFTFSIHHLLKAFCFTLTWLSFYMHVVHLNNLPFFHYNIKICIKYLIQTVHQFPSSSISFIFGVMIFLILDYGKQHPLFRRISSCKSRR